MPTEAYCNTLHIYDYRYVKTAIAVVKQLHLLKYVMYVCSLSTCYITTKDRNYIIIVIAFLTYHCPIQCKRCKDRCIFTYTFVSSLTCLHPFGVPSLHLVMFLFSSRFLTLVDVYTCLRTAIPCITKCKTDSGRKSGY